MKKFLSLVCGSVLFWNKGARTMATRRQSEIIERQSKILAFICKSIERDGVPPSLDDIGAKFGLAKSHARYELLKLETKGFIKRKPFCARAIKVLRLPDKPQASASDQLKSPSVTAPADERGWSWGSA
jgi:SOS-response transcriptional repressor LexA